jgi:predicted nucleotidyltransferase
MSELQAILNTLRKLKPVLTSKYSVNSIGLFGSIVNDSFSSEKSDIDIIVEFSRPISIEFIDLANYLESQINRKVDLVSKNGIKKKYYREIEREIVYA